MVGELEQQQRLCEDELAAVRQREAHSQSKLDSLVAEYAPPNLGG